MSGNDDIEELKRRVEDNADFDRKKKELEENRVNTQYEKMSENKERYEAIKESKFGTISRERAEELARESTDYFVSAKKQYGFINKSFAGKVPFYEKNLILIGARTGEGKTTCMANIVHGLITQKHPVTGKPGRCLVITNEESIVDFYNRLTCLIKGWHYVDHELFTEEQLKTFEQYIKILSTRVTIVDDQHNTNGKSLTGATTTPEGVATIFENLLRDGEQYDAVLIDYYQGVNESAKDPSLDEYKCQRKLTHILEKYRKVYAAPIVLLCQIDPPDEDHTVPFQRRVQGTKLICTRATLILEIVKHAEHLMTEWIVHKGRFAQLGKSIQTGYKNGLFVPYDDAFRANVTNKKEMKEELELNKKLGIKVGEPVSG